MTTAIESTYGRAERDRFAQALVLDGAIDTSLHAPDVISSKVDPAWSLLSLAELVEMADAEDNARADASEGNAAACIGHEVQYAFGTESDPRTPVGRAAAERARRLGSVSTKHITQFVLKIRTDCQLRCTYCYEYPPGDDGWKDLPPIMDMRTIVRVARRVGAHAVENALPEVEIIFHGGEPFFMKDAPTYIQNAHTLLDRIIRRISPQTNVLYKAHTNGEFVTPELLETLLPRDIKLGFSVDGDRETHNRRRKRKHGPKGSYDGVVRAINLVRSERYHKLYSGILGVIDISTDPTKYYQALKDLDPPAIDLLLPFATHDDPPYRPEDNQNDPYAQWLLEIYKVWLKDQRPRIRILASFVNLAMGNPSRTEMIGPTTGGEVTLRTDGSYELVDALKLVAGQATGMNVRDNSVAEVAELMRAHGHLGRRPIPTACKPCPVVEMCGGGHPLTRVSKENGFDNPSVFCADFKTMFERLGPLATVGIGRMRLDRELRDQDSACYSC